MADKRFAKRVAFRASIMYGDSKPPENHAFLTDLSNTGICIKTNNVYKPGTRVFMLIDVEKEKRQYEAEGIVTWAKKVPSNLSRVAKSGMGIAFTRISRSLLNLYEEKVSMYSEAP